MRRNSSLIPAAAILIVALLLGGLVGWWASRGPEVPGSNRAASDAPAQEESGQAAAQDDTASMQEGAETQVVVAEGSKPEPVPVYHPPEAPLSEQNWEEKLDQVLGNDDLDYPVKADKLADMIPVLPPHAQKDLAEHLVNLVSDEDFHKKAASIVLDEKLNKDVTEVLFNDLMNRHEGLRLPLVLKIAQNENHPLRDEARETLEMTLQEEFGKDWAKWQTAIDESLKSQGLEADPNLTKLLGATEKPDGSQ